MIRTMPLTDIRVDADMQARAEMDWNYVNQLAAYIKEGVLMHPMLVYYDGTYYWLVDGFHRYSARMQVDGIADPTCEVVEGTKQEAEVAALGANMLHGKPLTRAERNRNAMNVIAHPLCADWTNSEIGAHVGLSKSTVNVIRARMSGKPDEAPEPTAAVDPPDGEPSEAGGSDGAAQTASAGGATAIRDMLDNVIIGRAAQEAFLEAMPKLREIQIKAKELRKLIKDACVGQAGRYMPRQQAEADARNIWVAAKHSLPYCVVPDVLKGTDSRWDCGWMNRVDYDLLAPENQHAEG